MVSSIWSLKKFKTGVQVVSFLAVVKIVYYVILLTHLYTKSHSLKIQNASEAQFEVPFIYFFFLFHKLWLKFKAKKHKLFQ